MNNKLFGNERDFYKYALLRLLADMGDTSIGVCWMLTQGSEESGEGKFDYLYNNKGRDKDRELFDFLYECVCEKRIRDVSLINDNIILGAKFFADDFPPNGAERNDYWEKCLPVLRDCDLMFLDPDTGLLYMQDEAGVEHKLNRYVRWEEVRHILNNSTSSLMIFQSFHSPLYTEQGHPTSDADHKKTVKKQLSIIADDKISAKMIWKHPVVYCFLLRKEHEDLFYSKVDDIKELGFEILE